MPTMRNFSIAANASSNVKYAVSNSTTFVESFLSLQTIQKKSFWKFSWSKVHIWWSLDPAR